MRWFAPAPAVRARRSGSPARPTRRRDDSAQRASTLPARFLLIAGSLAAAAAGRRGSGAEAVGPQAEPDVADETAGEPARAAVAAAREPAAAVVRDEPELLEAQEQQARVAAADVDPHGDVLRREAGLVREEPDDGLDAVGRGRDAGERHRTTSPCAAPATARVRVAWRSTSSPTCSLSMRSG